MNLEPHGAAAIDLARNGHDVTLYERSTDTNTVGYAFRQTPNADRCLKYLGIDLQDGGAVAASTQLKFEADGTPGPQLMKENADKQKQVRTAEVKESGNLRAEADDPNGRLQPAGQI